MNPSRYDQQCTIRSETRTTMRLEKKRRGKERREEEGRREEERRGKVIRRSQIADAEKGN